MQSVSVPPPTTVVPEEALTQDCTARLSHGDVNRRRWVTAKQDTKRLGKSSRCSSFSLTIKIRVFIKEQTRPGEQRVRDRFIHGDLATTSCCFYLGMPPPPTRYGGKGSARCSPSLLAGYPHALLDVDDACVQHYETRAWGGSRITPIHCPAVMTVPEDGNIGPQGPHVESKTFYYCRLSFIMHTYE